jgi:hypothetical protein
MRHTLKAVFAHRSDAQHVLDELLASGYSRADPARSSTLATGQAGCFALEGENTAVGGPVKRLAERLLGSEWHKHAAADPGTSMHASYVVTLAADSGPDLERAVAIIERGGPFSIDDHDDEFVPGVVDAGTDVPGTAYAYPPGTEPGALQGRAHEDTRYFGTQSADAPPTGNTFEEPMDSVSPWVHPDDGRLHVPTPASLTDSGSAAQDDGAPAYLCGSESLNSDWERGPAGTSPTWDKFKAAVRHGWDRVRS